MSLKSYNPKRVSIKWKGIELNSDTPDGVFINFVKDVDAWARSSGNDGVEIRIRQNRLGGIVELTVNKSSDVNRLLLAIAERDRITEAEVGPMNVADPSGPGAGSGALAHDAYLLAVPNFARSNTEIGSVTWRWGCSRIDEFDLGVATTVVGA